MTGIELVAKSDRADNKERWDPKEHPRGKHGRFASVAASALGHSTNAVGDARMSSPGTTGTPGWRLSAPC